MLSKTCPICSKVFFKTPNLSQKTWETSRKYCSISCRVKALPMPTRKTPFSIGENHPNWKGGTNYSSLHKWIAEQKGKANYCANFNCQTKNPKKFEWSNISGGYKRDINDFESLCTWCHRKKDMGGRVPWNKGKKDLQKAWNKGLSVRLNPKGEFKKGNIPWNKGIPNSGFKQGYTPWNKKVVEK